MEGCQCLDGFSTQRDRCVFSDELEQCWGGFGVFRLEEHAECIFAFGRLRARGAETIAIGRQSRFDAHGSFEFEQCGCGFSRIWMRFE